MQIVHRARDRRTGKVTAIIIANRMSGPNRSTRNGYFIFFGTIKLIKLIKLMKLIIIITMSTIDTIRRTRESTIRGGKRCLFGEGRTA